MHTQINIPAYCEDTKICIRELDICNLHGFHQDPCLISKTVCQNHQFQKRKCYNDSYYIACQGHWPGQCIPRRSWGDKIYDCLDRSDELPTFRLTTLTPFDYAKNNLTECYTKNEGLGLSCEVDNVCVPYSKWCKPSLFSTLTVDVINESCRLIDDPDLCGNITFWNSTNREKSSCNYACSGTYPGQCSTEANVCDGETDIEHNNCHDKTDEICTESRLPKGTFKKKCDDYNYPYCANKKQCVHPNLTCDGIINCDDSSDEDTTLCNSNDCTNDASKTFSCQHVYTKVQICSSRCDNVRECFGGIDEDGCEENWFIKIISVAIVLSALCVSYFWDKIVIVWLKKKYPNRIQRQDEELNANRKNIVENMVRYNPFSKGSNSSSVVEMLKAQQLIQNIRLSYLHSHHLKFVVQLMINAFDAGKRNILLKLLYRRELSLHKNSKSDTEHCIKVNIETNEVCQTFLDAQDKSLMEKVFGRCCPVFLETCQTFWDAEDKSLMEKVFGCCCPVFLETKIQILSAFLAKVTNHYIYVRSMAFLKIIFHYADFKIIFHYADLVKDVILLILICYAINVSSLAFDSFSAQLIIAYVLSICLPLLVNWIYIAFYHLEEVCGCIGQTFTLRLRILMQFVTFILIPFMPAILMHQQAIRKEKQSEINTKINEQFQKDENVEEIVNLSRETDKLNQEQKLFNKLCVMYTKAELFEVLFQTCIAITLVCMNYYGLSITTGELQGFFDEAKWYLPIAILLSFRKVVNVSLHLQEVAKDGFQTLLGMIIYGVYAIVSSVVRMSAIVIYFSIPLGLFNLLIHWVYETTDLTWREQLVYSEFNNDVKQYELIFLKNISSKLISTDDSTQYTGLSLKSYYAIFCMGMIVHFILVFGMDVLKNKRIRKRLAITTENINLEHVDSRTKTLWRKYNHRGLFSSFMQAFTSYVIPDISADWDEDDGTLEVDDESSAIMVR